MGWVCALETTHMKAIFDRDKKCHASPIGDTILYVLFAWPPHNTFSSGVGRRRACEYHPAAWIYIMDIVRNVRKLSNLTDCYDIWLFSFDPSQHWVVYSCSVTSQHCMLSTGFRLFSQSKH